MYKVLVFGTGNGAEKLKSRIKNEINVLAYVDNDKNKIGSHIDYKKVISPSEIINYNYDYIIIASDFYEEISMQLINLNINKNKIIEFFNINSNLINDTPLKILIKKDLFVRNLLSKIYLHGNGIEIGALHNPLWKTDDVKVRYVDIMSVDDLRLQYPELSNYNLVPVDIIDNGEKLEKVNDESLDFIICNHMLEHCENPIGV